MVEADAGKSQNLNPPLPPCQGGIQRLSGQGDVGRGLRLNATLQQSEIALGVVGGVIHQHQVRPVAVGFQGSGVVVQASKVVVAEDVAVDDGENFTRVFCAFTLVCGRGGKQGQGIGDAAGGFQRVGFG